MQNFKDIHMGERNTVESKLKEGKRVLMFTVREWKAGNGSEEKGRTEDGQRKGHVQRG